MSKSGQRTTEQFLQSLPTVNANVIPQSNNENGSNTAVGAATIALRGFDARATLILIDGRRVAPYPTGNNPGLVNVMFVDLNSIPAAAIDSIEILKDGAATTYGADAVAGVVNIKLRHDYQNYAETSVQYGNTEHEDSSEFLASAIFGVGDNTTNITGVLNYYHRNSIANRDRAYSAVPPFLSSNASPYNLELSSDVAAAAGGLSLNPGGTEFAGAPSGTNGLAPASTYLYNAAARVRSSSGQLPGFDFNEFSLSYPEAERYGGYFAADHKVFGDQMVLYADAYYQNVKTHNELAAPASGSFQTFGQTILAIPPHSPIAPGAEPLNTPTHAETGVPADAFNPFNPFGDFRVPIPSNQATVEFARVHPKDEDISKLWTLDGNVYTTSLFELPGGGVGFAFGGQFRRETLEETPDMLNVEGDIVGNSPVPPARGGRKSYSLYAEARVPFFGENFTFPGLHSLEFSYGVRFEEFLNNDSNVLVPKFGMRWQPFDEQLTIRSTWGEGYREPSLEELFGSPLSTLEPSHDPMKGGAFEPETNTLIISNRNLQPEDSRTFTAGFVYTPKYVPGLNLSVDFWDTERIGVVTAPLADQVLQRELTGTLLPGEAVERDIGGNITRIITQNQNIGNQESRGFDFTVQYQKPTPWGTFTSLTQATYLDEFIFQGFIFREFGPTNGNLAGRTLDPGTSNEGWYKWKGTSQLDWNWNHIDIIGTVRYTDGFHEFTPNFHQHWVHQT